MPKKTEDYRKDKYERACDVRRRARVPGLTADHRNKNRERGRREQHAARVNANATDPLFEVVSMRFENKPLISKE